MNAANAGMLAVHEGDQPGLCQFGLAPFTQCDLG